MPKVDGKEYPYTDDGQAAAAVARKRKREIDSGERTVGKKTGTLPKQSAADTRKAKKHAKGVQRSADYKAKDSKLRDYKMHTEFSAIGDVTKAAEKGVGVREADYKLRRQRIDNKQGQRKLDREYPKSAAHKKSMKKAVTRLTWSGERVRGRRRA